MLIFDTGSNNTIYINSVLSTASFTVQHQLLNTTASVTLYNSSTSSVYSKYIIASGSLNLIPGSYNYNIYSGSSIYETGRLLCFPTGSSVTNNFYNNSIIGQQYNG